MIVLYGVDSLSRSRVVSRRLPSSLYMPLGVYRGGGFLFGFFVMIEGFANVVL